MKPWEPQQSESSVAYQAFAEYRDLGPDRSLDAVRLKFNKSSRLIARWSSNWKWVERVREYDAHLDSIRLASRESEIAKEARRIMTADEVRQGLTRIAEADIAEIFEPDGRFDLASAKRRGASKLIKSLSFDKDTGRVVKVETYSAHEGHRDMGKTHGIFVDKLETEDKTPLSPSTIDALKALAKQLSGRDLTDAEASKLMSDSLARAGVTENPSGSVS